MSFQGDVAGIGLAELLQSIARGRREGVLTLTGRNGLRCNLGLQSGVLYLLPATDEDPVIWKERARQAWVHDPDVRVDAMRMSEIARAHRIENLYRLLDCEGVHFRFETGPLPEHPNELRAEDVEPGARRMPSVHCEGIAVEFLLLEYARISDEQQRAGSAGDLSHHTVPRPLDPSNAANASPGFYRQCDGTSSLQEIADRLAWPIRQVRLVALAELAQGRLRLAAARELLVLAQRELERGYLSRAASRLSAWVQTSTPGPCDEGDALLLEAEWKAERLTALLNLMPTREARILLRRMDHALGDLRAALRHWRELQRLHRHCPITLVHRIACEHRCEEEEDTPSVRELLEVARGLREAKHPRRAAALLRIAADQVPATITAQLELGMGMLAADLANEAKPWILGAAATLIEEGVYDKAIPPLRALMATLPNTREARALLTRARNLAMRRQLIRKHSVVALAILLSLSLGAYVQVRMDRSTERKLTEIANLISRPHEAVVLLDEYFPGDDTPRVRALREAIGERARQGEEGLRSVWYARYSDAQLECTLGDPLLGLRRAMDLPAPPVLLTLEEPWPLVADLFNGLAARLENTVRDLGPPAIDASEQLHREQRLVEVITLQKETLTSHATRHDVGEYRSRLETLAAELERRARERTAMIAERDRLDRLNNQDMLLAAARSHAAAGDDERALEVYRRLSESDPSGKLGSLFAPEIAKVEARHALVSRARALAAEGKHVEALAALGDEVQSPRKVSLPWRLVVHPAGAEVRFPDGTLRHSPLVLDSPIGETLVLRLSSPGTQAQELIVDQPRDREVWLARAPERAWRASGRVECLPVGVGRDHVVGDRGGKLARIGEGGEALWEQRLGTLGGVARAPVFLPRKPGVLLVLTEDGEAWMVDAKSGTVEGPHALGAHPIAGPLVTQGGVVARLADGRLVRWEQGLQPSEAGSRSDEGALLEALGEEQARHGSPVGLEVLRRSVGGSSALDSPWNSARVVLDAEVYRVVDRTSGRDSFYVHRQGEWNYLAWEAPHAQLPTGRLWISDGAGLRAFVP